MRANRATETFQGNFAEVFELEPLANTKFGNRVGHQDLFWSGMLAQPARQLNRRSKEIVMLLDRLTCCGADSNLERTLGIRLPMFVQLALNLNCAANRARCRNERGHDAVAGVLNLAPA